MRGRRRVLAFALIGLGSWSCAAGNQEPTGSGGSGGESSSTTSSASTTTISTTDTGAGGSGAGGAGGTTATGGGGSTGTTATGGGGSTGTTSSTGGGGAGGSGGAPPTETALVLAASSSEVLGAEYHPGGVWAVSSPGAGSSHRPAVALLDAATGVGLYRQASDGALLFVKWSAGSFSPPLAIGGLATALDAPSLVRWDGGAAAAYMKPDFKHHFARYQGPMAGWSPVAEAILANNVHSFGPSAPAVAIVKGDVVVAYAGDNGNLYDQKRAAGVWQAANGHGVDGTVTLTPAIVAIPIGATEVMIAYVRSSDKQVMFTTRGAVTWSPPAAVPNAFTNDPVALTSTPGDGAVLAFRGLDGMLYTAIYTPGNAPVWSAPAAFGASTSAPPAVAPGIGGTDAEMVFVSAGEVRHARLSAGAWSSAETIGGSGITSAAIATFAP